MDVVENSVEDEVRALEALGNHTSFDVLDGSRLRCSACRRVVPCAEVPLLEVRRVEGPSDPAEMAAVLALRCPRCSAHGTLALGFGPCASAEDQDAFAALSLDERGPDRRRRSPRARGG